MFEKFTERARKVMTLARQDAQRRQQEFIGTEHILVGLIQEGGGSANKILGGHKITLAAVNAVIEAMVKPSTAPSLTTGQLPFSPRCKRVLELAGEFASKWVHEVVGTEHLLAGLVKENEGIAAAVLQKLLPGVDVLGEIELACGIEKMVGKRQDHRDAIKDRDTCLRELAYSHLYMKYLNPDWREHGEGSERQWKRLKTFFKKVAIHWHTEVPDFWKYLYDEIRDEFENLC